MSSVQPFRLMDLPPEIRADIFGYLLPCVPVIGSDMDIDVGHIRYPEDENPYIRVGICAGSYSGPWFPGWKAFQCVDVMVLNRQVHAETIAYLYSRKTYVATVYDYGFDFLDRSCEAIYFCPMPYDQMKEFVIRIVPCNLPTAGGSVRKKLIKICGEIDEFSWKKKIHFKKLRIACMTESSDALKESQAAWTSTLWQNPEDDDEPRTIPPPISDTKWNHPNFEHQAWQQGFDSSLAYLLTPLRMLSGIADEAVVEFPTSCDGKKHYEALKRYYEEGLDGRKPFCEQSEVLIDMRWQYKHYDGPIEFCEDMCPGCVEHTMAGYKKHCEEVASLERLHLEWAAIKNDDLEDWERWKKDLHQPLTRWQRLRKGGMGGLEGSLGKAWGNRVYHWMFPKSWRWTQLWSMIPFVEKRGLAWFAGKEDVVAWTGRERDDWIYGTYSWRWRYT
ncbi:MAG: hypothetical protein Q9168_003560 [Polycauliona sp. 1 TL-2023]